MLFGGYEGNPVSRWEDGVPWEHGSQSLPPDEERFRPLLLFADIATPRRPRIRDGRLLGWQLLAAHAGPQA